MKTNYFLILMITAIFAVMGVSCKKTPAPTAEIFATIDSYTVTFNPTVSDVKTYDWDFGDGEKSTEAAPVHTYKKSGTYTVRLTVKGDGGEISVTKDITIAASVEEMLTGGPSAVNGKTWVLSTSYTAGQDGGGPVQNAMPITIPSAENVLDLFGLGEEYDNEFTFFSDGSYKMTPKNGKVLAGAVYGVATGTISGDPVYEIGMCAATFDPPATATWSLGTTDFIVDAITDPDETNVPPVHADVTFTGKTWVKLSAGAYFGVLDFPTIDRFIIKSITPSKMTVALFLCGYGYGDDPEMIMLPTNLIQLTYVPK